MNINKNIKRVSIGMILGLGLFFGAGEAEAQSVKIQKGNTLSQIAKQHGTTVEKLKELNNLKTSKIYVGQTIKVKNTVSSANTSTSKNNSNNGKYTVKKGDTLSKIAKSYGTTVDSIKSINGLKKNTVYVGQVLNIKSSGTVSKAQTVNQKTNVSQKETTSKSSIVAEAKKHIGVKYVWGGQTTKGFDCSGYISYVLKKEGKIKSRGTTASFWKQSAKVSSPEAGDLIFFQNTYRKGVSHMGVYLGDGKFIHASTSDGVTITSVNDKYWKSKFLGYGRI